MIFPVKPMLPTLASQWPTGNQWIYEAKYDGYRGQLIIQSDKTCQLFSRNLKKLSDSFPEIISYCQQRTFTTLAPCVLDGEICVLESDYKANFAVIQQRGRLKNVDKIKKIAKLNPATFVVFDILMLQGKDVRIEPLSVRKDYLKKINITKLVYSPIQVVQSFVNPDVLWREVQACYGEGIVAKTLTHSWLGDHRTESWIKVKNYQKGVFFITGYDKRNHYFHVGLYDNKQIIFVGLFIHGLSNDEKRTLIEVIKTNKTSETNQMISIQPSICVELNYIEWYYNKLRQPRFSCFKLDWHWEDCTWEKMRLKKFK